MMALRKAIASPIAISPVVLSGKFPLSPSANPVKSTEEMSMTPANDAPTPISFRSVNGSMPAHEQRMSVQMLLVDVKIVALPTLVCSKHADAK